MSDTQQELDARAQVHPPDFLDNALAVKAALRDIERGEKGRPFAEFAREFCARNKFTDDL